MSKVIKYRRFCGFTYIPMTDFIKLLDEKSNIIRDYAWILHDNDYHTDGDKKGQLKEPHIHYIFLMSYAYPIRTVQRWFRGWIDDKGLPCNTFCEPVNDLIGSFEYLDHRHHPDKAQYDSSLIHCSNPRLFSDELSSCPEDSAFQALDMMLNGVPYYELARTFGRDFIFHYSQIRQLADDIKHQEQMLYYKKNKLECEEKLNGLQNHRQTN